MFNNSNEEKKIYSKNDWMNFCFWWNSFNEKQTKKKWIFYFQNKKETRIIDHL